MNSSKFEQIRERIIRHVQHTLEYCREATREEFNTNLMLQEACIFNVIQVGELAAKAIEWEMETQYPEIQWRQMRGMRNRIVHDYDGVRLDIVWDTIQIDFPILLEKLKTAKPNA